MIYFIQAGENGPIKIGQSDDPKERLKQLQVANPQRNYANKAIMEDRMLNFILVLVTGRVWGNSGSVCIDIWDCKPWMDFIRLHFTPSLFCNGEIKLHNRYK